MPFRLLICVALVGALLPLQGCGGTLRDALGLSKRQPDEFAVVRRQPLIMPPDYGLRAPQPGSEGPQIASAREQARSVLAGEAAAGETAPAAVRATPPVVGEVAESEGEAALLARAGGAAADPAIRQKVAQEAQATEVADPTLLGRLLDWRRPGPQDPVLDPTAEAQRLATARRETAATPGDESLVVLRREQTPIDLQEE